MFPSISGPFSILCPLVTGGFPKPLVPYIYVTELETWLHICDRFSGIRRFHGHEFEGDQGHSITASSIHTPSSTSYDEYASFVLVSSRLLYGGDVLYLSRAPIAGSYVDYISHNYTSCPSPINHTSNTALHSPRNNRRGCRRRSLRHRSRWWAATATWGRVRLGPVLRQRVRAEGLKLLLGRRIQREDPVHPNLLLPVTT